MTHRSKNCVNCGELYTPRSNRAMYCDPCKVEVRRNTYRSSKRKLREEWIKEPSSLDELTKELQNWGGYDKDWTVHPDRWFTHDNYIEYDYEEIYDLLEELKDEEN